MNDLTQEELEERIRLADETVRSEPPGDPGERQEWIDDLHEVADQLDYVADMREASPKDWADLSYPERLRKLSRQARTAAESFSKPRHKRTLEEVFYPGGE